MLVSTSTHGGHVDTIDSQAAPGRRRRRLHSDEFKADAVAAEMENAVKQWPKFPIALFKRSLAKIQNILTGALEVKEPLGTTQNLQDKRHPR